MRKRHSTVPHRLGRRTNFIPSLEGRPAQWAQVTGIAGDPPERASVAAAVTSTLLTIGTDGQPCVATADVDSLKPLVPDQLLPVRRPASHKGMTNYISRAVVPTEAHEERAVWCESFNELSHLRDLLITRQPTQVTTQPLRLEWVMTTGVRSHVPDFLLREADGRMLLVDVTTTSKLKDPRLRAILQLTAATAEAVGWDYQVRSELPAQRVRNLNFLHAGRRDTVQDRLAASRQLRQAQRPVDVQRASEILGGPLKASADCGTWSPTARCTSASTHRSTWTAPSRSSRLQGVRHGGTPSDAGRPSPTDRRRTPGRRTTGLGDRHRDHP